MANIERRIRDGKVRWYARHYDPSGNRHTKVFDTKAEADRFLTSVGILKEKSPVVMSTPTGAR